MFEIESLGTIAGCGAVVAVILQFVKPWLPERVIPLIAAGTGIVLATGTYAVLNLAAITPAGLEAGVITGLLGGAAAVFGYEVQKQVRGA